MLHYSIRTALSNDAAEDCVATLPELAFGILLFCVCSSISHSWFSLMRLDCFRARTAWIVANSETSIAIFSTILPSKDSISQLKNNVKTWYAARLIWLCIEDIHVCSLECTRSCARGQDYTLGSEDRRITVKAFQVWMPIHWVLRWPLYTNAFLQEFAHVTLPLCRPSSKPPASRRVNSLGIIPCKFAHARAGRCDAEHAPTSD